MSTNILYFTADWCNPCKKVRPIVEELNKDQIEIKFQIIDVDSEGDLTRKFSVRSVPTFVRIENGEETSRITGAQTREQLERFMRNE
jgi:thioredoxin 1